MESSNPYALVLHRSSISKCTVENAQYARAEALQHNESVTLLPLQGECIHVVITQDDALGYELFGPSARFNRTVRIILTKEGVT